MKAKLAKKDPCDIINMDQTPIPYSFHYIKMLENKGARTNHVPASTMDTKQVTLTSAFETSGCMLPFLLIFKGMANGRIAKNGLSMYPDSGHYLREPKAGWTSTLSRLLIPAEFRQNFALLQNISYFWL